MNPADRFRSVRLDPRSYTRHLKKRTGRKVLGFFCSYAPVELIHAAGLHPFRLQGTDGEITRADSHLQSYCCSLVRGGLETALNGSLDFLDGAVFPHTCDSVQRLSDIWRLNAGFVHHFDVVLPVKLNTQSARNYMKDVLNGFRRQLEHAFETQITDEDIWASIRKYNLVREKLGVVHALRSSNPGLFEPSDVPAITAAAMVMEPEEFVREIDVFFNTLDAGKNSGAATGRKRIVLSGGICSHPDIYEILAQSGADVVWEDLCTGGRWFEGAAAEDISDPVEAIADRYLYRGVCPAKHSDINARGRELVETVRRHGADGVLFILLKFCDPHAFDYPYLRRFLDEAEIASQLLEIEDQPPPGGQLLTRFETFVDML